MIESRLSRMARTLGGQQRGDDCVFRGCSTDSRRVAAGELFVALRGAKLDGHAFVAEAARRGAQAALVERDLPRSLALPYLRVDDTLTALGQLAADWRRQLSVECIGITGSNGKTTTKEMLKAILAQQYRVHATAGNQNNAIGVPLTLCALDHSHQLAVIEMGANHLGEIAQLAQWVKPTTAVITQCVPSHLEGFGSIDAIAEAKGELIGALPTAGSAILNADDRYFDYWRALAAGRRVVRFGLDKLADISAKWYNASDATGVVIKLQLPEQRECIQVQLPLYGRHNVCNALSAVAAAHVIGAKPEAIVNGLSSLRSLPGRLRLKLGVNGMRILDDTYNANPASLKAAIEVLSGFSGCRWLVLGDMAELGTDAEALHAECGVFAAQHQLSGLFSLGSLSAAASAGFGTSGRHFNCFDALIRALQQALNDDAVVLVKGSRSMAMERVVAALQHMGT